jgi:hypothetical protein
VGDRFDRRRVADLSEQQRGGCRLLAYAAEPGHEVGEGRRTEVQ